MAFLAVTRPDARSAVDRRKVWTLYPRGGFFIANWIVTQDFWRASDDQSWAYENIDKVEAKFVALEAPSISAAEVQELLRPRDAFTLEHIDRHPVSKLLGKTVDTDLKRH